MRKLIDIMAVNLFFDENYQPGYQLLGWTYAPFQGYLFLDLKVKIWFFSVAWKVCFEFRKK